MAAVDTIANYVRECLKRRAMTVSELCVGSGQPEHIINGTLAKLESEGLVERRSGNDWGLVKN